MKRIKKYVYLGLMVGGIVVASFLEAMEPVRLVKRVKREERQRIIALSKQLYDAINNQDAKLVENLLIMGADSNYFSFDWDEVDDPFLLNNNFGWDEVENPLLNALTVCSDFVIPRLLLKHGADIKFINRELTWGSGNIGLIKFFLDNGCVYKGRENLLMYAASDLTIEVVQWLVNRGENVNEVYNDSILGNKTALSCAFDRYKYYIQYDSDNKERIENALAVIKALVVAGARGGNEAEIDLRLLMDDEEFYKNMGSEAVITIQEGLVEFDLSVCEMIPREIKKHTCLSDSISYLVRDYTLPYISENGEGSVSVRERVQAMRDRIKACKQVHCYYNRSEAQALSSLCSLSESLPMCTPVSSSASLEKQEESEESRDGRMVVCDNCTAYNVHGVEKCVTCFYFLGN